jgi:elongation factor G
MPTQTDMLRFPLLTCSLKSKRESDREKLAAALSELSKSGQCPFYVSDEVTGILSIGGINEQHLESMIAALKRAGNAFSVGGLEIVYRETVARKTTADFTHKKLFGGIGQFARVIIDIEPTDIGAGYEFENRCPNDSVPAHLVSGVEKGLSSVLLNDALVRSQNFDVKTILVDGAFHESDSSILTFEIAARAAFREGLDRAATLILEPIMRVDVTSTEDFVGLIIRDLHASRGTIVDTSQTDDQLMITAMVPLANLLGYNAKLRALSQDHASFSMTYSHYHVLPGSNPSDPENFPPAMAMRA